MKTLPHAGRLSVCLMCGVDSPFLVACEGGPWLRPEISPWGPGTLLSESQSSGSVFVSGGVQLAGAPPPPSP